MKVTLRELYGSYEPLQALGQQKLRGAVTFRLRDIFAAVKPKVEEAERVRVEMVYRYTNGNEPPVVAPEHLDTYLREFQEILNVEVEIPGEKIDEKALADASMSVHDALLLGWLLEEKTDV